jgi:phosphopantetheinyl transferase
VVGIRRISEDLSVGILDLKAFTAVTACDTKREAEKQGARFLLTSMLGDQNVQVAYSAHNEPSLKGRPEQISITHSHDRLAIAVNAKERPGIDIELVRDKVIHVAPRFVAEEEKIFAGDDVERLIMLWAAKEALYKAGGERAVDFKEHIRVHPVGEHLLKGSIHLSAGPRNFLLFYKLVDGQYMLVFTLHEI